MNKLTNPTPPTRLPVERHTPRHAFAVKCLHLFSFIFHFPQGSNLWLFSQIHIHWGPSLVVYSINSTTTGTLLTPQKKCWGIFAIADFEKMKTGAKKIEDNSYLGGERLSFQRQSSAFYSLTACYTYKDFRCIICVGKWANKEQRLFWVMLS